MSSKRNKNQSTKGGGKPPAGKSPSRDNLGTPWPVVLTAGCGILAEWVAVGSAGLLVTPLRHAIIGLLLGTAVVALRPSWWRLVLVASTILAGIALSLASGHSAVVDALAVAAVLSALVFGTTAQQRRVLLIVAVAAGALAVFRAACFTVPTAWAIDGAIGRAMGSLGGLLGGQSPWIGGSLGGLDLLVLMGVFYVGWLCATPAPRAGRALWAAVAILIVQAFYLIGLSYATEIAAALPEMPLPDSLDPGDYRPTDWSVLGELRGYIPWNLPLLAAVLQAAVAMAMLRWTRVEARDGATGPPLRFGPGTRSSDAGVEGGATGVSPVPTAKQSSASADQGGGPGPQPTVATENGDTPRRRASRLLLVAAIFVAVGSGLLAAWPPAGGDLSGKTVVAYSGGYDRWIAPAHDALEPERSGTYGLLPSLVADLGGQWVTSDELSKKDLDRADVLVVIHPMKRWPQERVKRLEEYVREGGALLVVAGPMTEGEARREAKGEPADRSLVEAPAEQMRPVNELLRFSGMAFRGDVALSPADRWTGALSGSTHPAVLGLSRRTLALSLHQSCTIDIRWPTRPILVGRFGWSEPGSDMLFGGYATADATEQWGDLVLAAERPVGAGTVVTLGDYWCLTNLGVADGHELVGRLLRYLAVRPSNPQAMWRQVLALLGYLGLFLLVVWRPDPARLVAITLIVGGVLVGATCHARASEPIPVPPERGAQAGPARPIAYVDASHLEIGNDRPWANDSMDGFLLTLARNGYLPLKLHRWDAARLKEATLLVVMGPAKPFSADEIREIRALVEQGGHVICMIGATEAAASRGLLDEFEFELRGSPSPTGSDVPEAEPMGRFPEQFGRFSTNYLNAADYGRGNYVRRVWFFQGWPIDCRSNQEDWQPLVRGFGNRPMAIHRRIGKGKIRKGSIVLIGDSRFALNFGHGYYNGQLIESGYDNADFWRWLLSRVVGPREWIPPDPARRTRQGAFRGRGEVMR